MLLMAGCRGGPGRGDLLGGIAGGGGAETVFPADTRVWPAGVRGGRVVVAGAGFAGGREAPAAAAGRAPLRIHPAAPHVVPAVRLAALSFSSAGRAADFFTEKSRGARLTPPVYCVVTTVAIPAPRSWA